jgi:hypothetical protein
VLLGSAHYHLVPVVVVAAGVGNVAAGDAVVAVAAAAAVGGGAAAAAAAGTDIVAVAVAAAAVAGGVAAAAVAGSHQGDFGGIAVVLAEAEEEPVPAVCVDSPADVELAPKTAVVAERTELEAAVVAAWVLAVAAALAAAGILEQGRAQVLTSARQQPPHQRDCLQVQC